MNVKEIRDRTLPELTNDLENLKKELFHLRFQHAINQLENPMRMSVVKKDIAKIKTVLREREIQDSAKS